MTSLIGWIINSCEDHIYPLNVCVCGGGGGGDTYCHRRDILLPVKFFCIHSCTGAFVVANIISTSLGVLGKDTIKKHLIILM